MKIFISLFSFMLLTLYVSAQSPRLKKQLSAISHFRWDNTLNDFSSDTAHALYIEWSPEGKPLKATSIVVDGNMVITYIYSDFIYNPISTSYYFTNFSFYYGLEEIPLVPDWAYRISEVHYKNFPPEFSSYKTVSSYNEEGIKHKEVGYNLENGEWVESSKREYVFDSKNFQAGSLFYQMKNGVWDLLSGNKKINMYDQTGDLISSEIQRYTDSSDQWDKMSTMTFHYTGDRKIKSIVTTIFEGQVAEKSDSSVYTWHRYSPDYNPLITSTGHNERNLPSSIISYKFSNNIPELSYRKIYKYNHQDMLIEDFGEEFNNGVWEGRNLVKFDYYATGDLKYLLETYNTIFQNRWDTLTFDVYNNKYDQDGDILSWTFRRADSDPNPLYKEVHTYNNVYSIPETTPTAGLAIYPNPATTMLNFSFSERAQVYHVRIADLTGRVVMTDKLRGNNSVDITQLEAGTYIAIIESEGDIHYSKFIKQ